MEQDPVPQQPVDYFFGCFAAGGPLLIYVAAFFNFLFSSLVAVNWFYKDFSFC